MFFKKSDNRLKTTRLRPSSRSAARCRTHPGPMRPLSLGWSGSHAFSLWEESFIPGWVCRRLSGVSRKVSPPGVALHDPAGTVVGEGDVRDLAAQGARPEHRTAADLRRGEPCLAPPRPDATGSHAGWPRRPPALPGRSFRVACASHIANARNLPLPVTSLTSLLACSSLSSAVAVCGAIRSSAASAFGVSAG